MNDSQRQILVRALYTVSGLGFAFVALIVSLGNANPLPAFAIGFVALVAALYIRAGGKPV